MRYYVVIFVLLLVGCSQTTVEQGSIEAYFCHNSPCEEILVAVILDGSQVQCAFYELRLESVQDALREVNAQVLVFEEPIGSFERVRSRGLMHHKFCIIDNDRVITGSMNPTHNGPNNNDEVLFIIDSPSIVKNFLDEFKYLQTRQKKTTRKQEITLVRQKEVYVEQYFCPQDNCEEKIIETLRQANTSIHFLTFTFTSEGVGDTLLYLHNNNVSVQGVFEARTKSEYWQHDKLANAGVLVRVDGNSYTMHHKTFVIDEAIVLTGTYNPTRAANERNDEVFFVIHNKELATQFLEEFERIWDEGRELVSE